MTRLLRIPLLLTLVATLPGCVGYQLGSMLPKDIRTVYVPTVKNQTDEPLLESAITQAVIQRLQQDGSLEIATPETADAVLEITVRQYELLPISYSRENRTLANEYRVILTASARMVRRGETTPVVSNGNIRGDAYFDFNGDLTTARRQSLQLVADDLGQDIVEQVVEAW